MKSFFKRSAIGLAVLGIAGSVNAMGFMGTNGYFIGIEGLNLRPMNGDLDYYTLVANDTVNQTGAISTDHDWGWRLFGGLRFGANDDFTLSWLRLRASSGDSTNFFGTSHVLKYLGFSSGAGRAKVDFDLDEVYGVLGHTINFSNPWSVRFAGGIAYARLDSDFTVVSTFGPFLSNASATDKLRLKGWGPRGEFDIGYRLGYGFGIFATTNISLFVANREVHTDFFGEDGDLDFDNHFSSRNVIVPKIGMRLGGSYTWVMGQAGGEGGGCALIFTAGWQGESYIHAIERTDGLADGVPTSTKVSNFGDQGAFLGITFTSSWM